MISNKKLTEIKNDVNRWRQDNVAASDLMLTIKHIFIDLLT